MLVSQRVCHITIMIDDLPIVSQYIASYFLLKPDNQVPLIPWLFTNQSIISGCVHPISFHIISPGYISYIHHFQLVIQYGYGTWPI